MRGSRKKHAHGSVEKKNINEPNQLHTSVEIPMYAPNQGLAPREYQMTAQFIRFEQEFEKECKAFLSRCNPDEFNSSYMDAIIERHCAEGIKYINVQRCDHAHTIMKLLNGMHAGDYIKCKSKLKDFKHDKEVNREKLEKYREIYYRGTSLSNR